MTVSWEIREGDALEQLRDVPTESVHSCVTSPPYFGLRDYGVDGQIGLEDSPEEYIDRLVVVFAEVRRALRGDGTLWVNIGDSYNTRQRGSDKGWDKSRLTNPARIQKAQAASLRPRAAYAGSKPKDLLGIPWMLAFALRADGWWLRAENIWAKTTAMPESVQDRTTRSHEQVFMLAKSARCFYDTAAIAEPAVSEKPLGNGYRRPASLSRDYRGQPHPWSDVGGKRNKRSVWIVPQQPYAAAHFATFPPKLVEPCVLASTSPITCGDCGAPWRRILEISGRSSADMHADRGSGPSGDAGQPAGRRGQNLSFGGAHRDLPQRERVTKRWEPMCGHSSRGGASMILDPFAGAGTTGLVALRHDRSFIGIELNPTYAELARERIRNDAPLLNTHAEAAA